MATHEMLYVFCYDIARDSIRAKVSDVLEQHLVRVQMSVFEGRLSERAAMSLADQAWQLMAPDDSLRCYAVGAAGLRRSLAYGPTPLPEPGDYYLL